MTIKKLKPGMIQVKNTDVLVGLMGHRFDPKLIRIVQWIAERYGVLITESYRKPRHPGDLHATNPVRAVDIRSWVYPDPRSIADAINAQWQYDPKRPDKVCALLHDVGNGMHFHVQVHPGTIKKERKKGR